MKKLTSLMSVPEKRFLRSFDVHDLKLNEWNNIDGLEVMPVFSPHPVETTVFFFRTMWDGGYKTYTHLADIASREVLERMLLQAENHTPLSEKLFHQFTQQIEKSANLKKIDIGGGMIHGDAKDFTKDGSEKIVLAHLDRDLTPAEREIGSEASFGMEDVLIPTRHDYIRDQAGTYLRSYFPAAAENDIIMLLNCPIETLNIGHILQKRTMPNAFVYLIITGVAEMIQTETGKVYMLSAGTLIGESCALGDEIPNCTYRAKSYINVLEIPQALYRSFIMRSADHEDARRTTGIAFFLQTTPLFGETVSSPVLYSIAVNLVPLHVSKGEKYDNVQDQSLIIVVSGRLEIRINGVTVDTIGKGDFFGEECVFFTGGNMMSAIAIEDCECYTIGANRLRDIPIIEWKMLEVYERRLTVYGGKMS
jgi:hemerythrin